MNINKAKLYFFNLLNHFYTKNELASLYKFIFEHITGKDFSQIIANPDLKIDKQHLDKIINRLKNKEPYQYITGKTEFYDLNFFVDKNVLIPRPETEELVDLIIRENKTKTNLNILDIGTGSGCIIISLASNLNCNICQAIDVSEQALKIAQKNAILNNVNINFINTDILKINDKIFDLKFDIIVSNPPYVTDSQKIEMQKNVLDFEPHTALFVDDNNPLVFYEKIAQIARKTLKSGGKLYFEINENFASETKKLLIKNKATGVTTIKDLNKKDRIVTAEFI